MLFSAWGKLWSFVAVSGGAIASPIPVGYGGDRQLCERRGLMMPRPLPVETAESPPLQYLILSKNYFITTRLRSPSSNTAICLAPKVSEKPTPRVFPHHLPVHPFPHRHRQPIMLRLLRLHLFGCWCSDRAV
ncbi:hypothetical protein QUA00_36065 [Microcoleus sp. T2B6]|uniref:hypothetical protein n=1 Tax=unclassified Microcoleus TaxID=2642155 RepID=UPI002FD2E62C